MGIMSEKKISKISQNEEDKEDYEAIEMLTVEKQADPDPEKEPVTKNDWEKQVTFSLSMVKALIYFASTLMLLLAVSIITNAIVFSKSIATNCDDGTSDDLTDMRSNKPIAVSVTIDTRVNEELTSKLISSSASTTKTTTKTSSTSTTTTSTTRWYTTIHTVDNAF